MGGVFGQQDLSSGNTPFNELVFVIQQALGRINVATLVQVKAVNVGSGLAPVGTVDVLPLINQVAGDGSAVPHTTIHNLPYLRIQGGVNAIICDPAVGDIGFCVFADRDISSVQASGAQGNPGSARRFDMADGLYLGGWCSNLTPQNYLLVNASEIEMVFGSNSVVVNASGITLNGPVQINGAVTGSSTGTFTGNVKAGAIDLETHVHTGVQGGSGNTGGPTG